MLQLFPVFIDIRPYLCLPFYLYVGIDLFVKIYGYN